MTRDDEQRAKAEAYAIADNRTAELSEWDDMALSRTLQDYRDIEPDTLPTLGFDEEDMAEIERRIEDEARRAANAGGGGGGGGGEEYGPPVVDYVLRFDDAEQKAVWDGFRRLLKSQYPEYDRETARILAHVRETLNAQGMEAGS